MDIDFKALKKILDETVMTEAKCMELMGSLLTEENKVMQNAVLDKIIPLLTNWAITPPIETLKALEGLASQKS